MKKTLSGLLFLSTFFCVSTFCMASDNSALSDLSEGLRDVKAPVYFPRSYLFLFVILIIALIGGLIGLIYLMKKRPKKVEELPVDPRSAWEIAFEELKGLEASSLLEQGQFKVYFSKLSNIVREYFENQFHIRAPEMTTEEFLWSLKASGDLTESHKDTLKKFLNSCDIVKFAKYIPRIEEGKESFQLARKLIEATKTVTKKETLRTDQS